MLLVPLWRIRDIPRPRIKRLLAPLLTAKCRTYRRALYSRRAQRRREVDLLLLLWRGGDVSRAHRLGRRACRCLEVRMSVGGLRRRVGHFETHHLLQRHCQILTLPCCLCGFHVRICDAIRRL